MPVCWRQDFVAVALPEEKPLLSAGFCAGAVGRREEPPPATGHWSAQPRPDRQNVCRPGPKYCPPRCAGKFRRGFHTGPPAAGEIYRLPPCWNRWVSDVRLRCSCIRFRSSAFIQPAIALRRQVFRSSPAPLPPDRSPPLSGTAAEPLSLPADFRGNGSGAKKRMVVS